MAGTWILRHTEHGRRLFPVDPIEAEKLEKLGKARRVKAGLYEAKVAEETPAIAPPPGPAPTDYAFKVLDDDEEGDKVYETKVMTPEEPKRRRRGRQRRVNPDVSD